jgi:hypothetical protein
MTAHNLPRGAPQRRHARRLAVSTHAGTAGGNPQPSDWLEPSSLSLPFEPRAVAMISIPLSLDRSDDFGIRPRARLR